ncbi:MAG: nucleotide exchange factor GrpE [Thermoanaerobaculaceae bacterium]|jgi:molecular chaperone GrpE|nr:nucleotide exchange factor GrpE [Thermoanaerobaculaceae bacterium]
MTKEERDGTPTGAELEETGLVSQGDVFETPELPSGEDDSLRIQMDELQQELDRAKELYLRKLADFDNYRKRQEREMAEYRKLANANLVRDLLQVVDNLERAAATASAADESLRIGVELVLRQFKDTLARHGVTEVDPDGKPFDPSLHEAIQKVDSGDVTENTVVQVLQKGYVLGERLLRPALVVVAVPVPRVVLPGPFEE